MKLINVDCDLNDLFGALEVQLHQREMVEGWREKKKAARNLLLQHKVPTFGLIKQITTRGRNMTTVFVVDI